MLTRDFCQFWTIWDSPSHPGIKGHCVRWSGGSVVPVFFVEETDAVRFRSKTTDTQNYFCTKFHSTVIHFAKQYENCWAGSGSLQVTHPILHLYLAVHTQNRISEERRAESPHWFLQNLVCKGKATSGEWINLFWSCEKSMFVCHTRFSAKGLGILSLIISELLVKSQGSLFLFLSLLWKQMEVWSNFDLRAPHRWHSVNREY